MASDKALVAARVSQDTADVLEGAAYVRRVSMQKLLAPMLEKWAAQLVTDPQVHAAVAARKAVDGAESNVTRLRKSRPDSST